MGAWVCRRPQVGLIIGRGGETIKGLQNRSGARIQVGVLRLTEQGLQGLGFSNP